MGEQKSQLRFRTSINGFAGDAPDAPPSPHQMLRCHPIDVTDLADPIAAFARTAINPAGSLSANGAPAAGYPSDALRRAQRGSVRVRTISIKLGNHHHAKS